MTPKQVMSWMRKQTGGDMPSSRLLEKYDMNAVVCTTGMLEQLAPVIETKCKSAYEVSENVYGTDEEHIERCERAQKSAVAVMVMYLYVADALSDCIEKLLETGVPREDIDEICGSLFDPVDDDDSPG